MCILLFNISPHILSLPWAINIESSATVFNVVVVVVVAAAAAIDAAFLPGWYGRHFLFYLTDRNGMFVVQRRIMDGKSNERETSIYNIDAVVLEYKDSIPSSSYTNMYALLTEYIFVVLYNKHQNDFSSYRPTAL